MSFTQNAQIYVSGLGEWFRVIDQTDSKIRLVNADGVAGWKVKSDIESLMDKPEPSLSTDGDVQW